MPLVFNGTTITAANFNGVALTQIIYNGVEIWTSFTPNTVGVYYAGIDGPSGSNTAQYSNRVTRINSSGTTVGGYTNIGTARSNVGGASVGDYGVYYGGGVQAGSGTNGTKIVTRINSSGTQVGGQTSAGYMVYRTNAGGASVGDYGVYYAGFHQPSSTYSTTTNDVTRINSSGTTVGGQTTIGTAKASVAGASIGDYGVYYGNGIVTRINSSGTQVGSETNVGTSRSYIGGASIGAYGVYYAGYTSVALNIVTRINSSGTQVGSETNVGTVRFQLAGASIGDYGVYYGGALPGQYYSPAVNTLTRINSSGAQVGSEASLYYDRKTHAAAGLQ